MHFLHKSANVQNAVKNTVRGAFEYSGQKCSATSRVYVPNNLSDQFKELIGKELENLSQGPADDFTSFSTSVINKQSYDKVTGYLEHSESEGYYISPTVLLTEDPLAPTMVNELFGPVVTLYIYPAEEYTKYLELADKTSVFALTAGLFAQDRYAIIEGTNKLRNAAGNFYINDKSTGAVVGQQPFGGSRASGTNDKAGAKIWVSARTIKESFVPIESVQYPSNEI
ncbi:hypothetical protein HK096_011529 [Nowakowskiella sp. JEL0078]|nr:hypothetical protein HK096_011529 [Nowakowskiella sp. JEL0078]